MRPRILSRRYGRTGLTAQRNNLTIAAIYSIPPLNQNRNVVARRALSGWGVAAIFRYYSGSPQFVSQSDDGQNNGNNFEYPDLVSGQPNGVPNRSIHEWFNTARFTEAIGHYGDAPRNPLMGGGAVEQSPRVGDQNESSPCRFLIRRS